MAFDAAPREKRSAGVSPGRSATRRGLGRRYSVVFPAKCSLATMASALVA